MRFTIVWKIEVFVWVLKIIIKFWDTLYQTYVKGSQSQGIILCKFRREILIQLEVLVNCDDCTTSLKDISLKRFNILTFGIEFKPWFLKIKYCGRFFLIDTNKKIFISCCRLGRNVTLSMLVMGQIKFSILLDL